VVFVESGGKGFSWKVVGSGFRGCAKKHAKDLAPSGKGSESIGSFMWEPRGRFSSHKEGFPCKMST
jgi:hypothetical protein